MSARGLAPLLAALLAASCGGSSAGSHAAEVHAGARTTTLGWLGAHAQPLASALDVDDEGERRTPGGLVIAELHEEGPLARAGARVGDVLVRTGEDWVPLAQDPTFELIERVEQAVSGGGEELTLAAWRAGALVELGIALDRPALEVGLPVEVERFRAGAAAALDRLVTWQRPEGGWPEGDGASELVVDALAGLALFSAAANETLPPEAVQPALARAAERVEDLAARAGSGDSLGLALAVSFLAERLGPLPPEVLLAAGPRVIRLGRAMELPDGAAPSGHMIVFGGPDGEGMELAPPEGGEMRVFSVTGSGELPEGLTLPEGVEIQIAGARGETPAAEGAIGPAGGEAPELGALLAEHDPARVAELERLAEVVDLLLAAQAEDGGWGAAAEDDASARLLPTAYALMALGAAQRVGLELEADPIERGCKLLRELAREGKVAAAVARGADRRDEAGRAAAAAMAFLALGCPETDPFVQALVTYSDEAGRHLLGASSELAYHLLATALLRRRGGVSSWARFYEEFRVPLVCWQRPDGAFEIPLGRDDAAQGESAPTFDTALGALLLELQSERLPALLALAENPLAPTVDGEGERQEPAAPAGAPPLPEGADQTVDPEQVKQLLESMGIDPEDADMQVITVGGEAPGEDG
jgi:hypothetical protein